MSSRGAVAAAVVLSLQGLGCQVRIGMALPLQRAVPLRVVKLVQCEGCTSCRRTCREEPRPDELNEAVRAANETFAPAGIRFGVASVERVEAPSWWFRGTGPSRTWQQILPEARRVFPWVPQNAWRPGDVKTTDEWLEVLTAAYARPAEITVYVQAGGTRAETAFPNSGRGVWASQATFGANSLFLFSHELGHYFGLRHTFAHAGTNPINLRPWRLADRWDLVYHPGSGPHDPHVFFSSRRDAARYSDRDLRLIERHGENGNCQAQPDGGLECVLPGRNGYEETHRSGEDALKGLSMPLDPRDGRGFRWARNATDYGDMAIPRKLSASQMEMIRIFLQHPMNIARGSLEKWGDLPAGVEALPSYRHTLGL